MKKTVSIFIFLQLSWVALAAWQPIVRNYSPQDYAAGTQNWQMMQSAKGWIYAGNNYGLLEFDGHSWHIYGIWNSSAIHSIAEGPDGELYVGGSNDFGLFKANKDGDLIYQPLSDSVPQQYRHFGEVYNIAYDEGLIYVQARNYIFICSENGHIEVVDPACIIYASLLQEHCLYIATSNGIYLYSGRRLHTLEGSQQLQSCTISAMEAYDDNRFLIATDFSGVYLCDGKHISRFVTDADAFLRRNQLYSMAVGEQHIAFGTVLRGVVVTDREGHNPLYIDRKQGVQNSTVLSLLFDRDQNLWLGLDQGIDLVELNTPLQYLKDPDEVYGSGYAYAETEAGAYFGTNQGLYLQRTSNSPLELVEGSLGQVWRLVKCGELVWCCHNRGLFAVNNGTFEHFDIPDGVWNVLEMNSEIALACTYNGFYLLAKTDGKYVVKERLRGYDETILYAELDSYGNVWTISSRGVERISFSSDYRSLTNRLVLEDSSRSRYAIARVGDKLIVSAAGYLAVAQEDGSLQEDDELAEQLAGKHKYEILQQDKSGNWLMKYDSHLAVRAGNTSGLAVDSAIVEVFDNSQFFVGGFANSNMSANGEAVLGGVYGFYRLNLNNAIAAQQQLPWAVRKVKVIVPLYRRWWAILLYIILLATVLYTIYKFVRMRMRMRDERLAAEKEAEIQRQKMRILELEREQAEYDLKSKSRELNSVLLNQVNRNEMAANIQQDVHRIAEQLAAGELESAKKGLRTLEAKLGAGMHRDKDWKRFEENFDFVNDRFIRRLSERFPWMNKQEKQLCVYIYMGLQTKEIGPLLNLSTRGVEMMRYRTRKKMDLDAQVNLKHYFEQMLKDGDE